MGLEGQEGMASRRCVCVCVRTCVRSGSDGEVNRICPAMWYSV